MVKNINETNFKYLAKNTLLFSISTFGSKILTFLLVPLYTNVLTTSDYGRVDIMTTTVALLSIALTINIASAVMRYSLEYTDIPEVILKYGIQVIIKGSLIMGIGTIIFYQIEIIDLPFEYYFFMIGLFVVNAFEQLSQNYLRAIEKVELMVITGLFSTFIKLSCNVITLLVLKIGVIGYMISMVIGPAVSCLIAFLCLYPIKNPNVDKITKNNIHKEMRRYAIPTAVNSLGWWIANSVDRYFVTWMKGASINGIYSVSYKIPTIMSMFCDIFIQAWGLSAIKEYDKDDKNDFFNLVYTSFNAGLVLICSILIFTNTILAKVLFANEFYEAWKYSSILIISMFFSGLSSFLGGIYGAAKHNDELAISTFISAIVNIILDWLLIPNYGAYGAAIATAVSFYIIWILRFVLLKKYIDLSIKLLKCHVTYLLLVIQVVLEHFSNHNYLLQSSILLIIVMLCYKDLYLFFYKIKKAILSKILKGDRN